MYIYTYIYIYVCVYGIFKRQGTIALRAVLNLIAHFDLSSVLLLTYDIEQV